MAAIEVSSEQAKAGTAFPLWRRVPGWSPTVLLFIAILLVLVIPPLVYLVQTSFFDTKMDGSIGDFTYENWQSIFNSPLFGRYVLSTAIYSLGSAVLAIALGTGQAWLVARTNTPLRQYVFLFSVISLGIPGVLNTAAWVLLLGRTGPINEVLKLVTGSQLPLLNVNSMGGMILIEGINWAPLAFLMISSVFQSADSSFEEAALMSGANIGRTFWDITLKLAFPAVLALAMLISIRAFESFEIPALVGLPGNVYVLTTEIYSEVMFAQPPNYGHASALSIALLGIVVAMLYFYSRLTRRADRYQTITGKGYRPRLLDLGRFKYLGTAFLVLFFVVVIVLPLLMLLWISLMPNVQMFSMEGLSRITMRNYQRVITSPVLLGAVINSLILGVAAATLTAVFTLAGAWFVVRRYRGGWLLDQLATMPLIFPSIVLGVALLQLFIGMPFGLYGSLLSLVIASCIRNLPYGMRYAHAGVLQIHKELEEASAISGASKAETFFRIVVPLVAPALTTSWLFIFLLVVGSVSLPIMLTGPNSSVVAVMLLDMWASGSSNEVAALGLLWTLFMSCLAAAFSIIARRYGVTVK